MFARRLLISASIAGLNDKAYFLDPRGQGFFHDELQRRFIPALPIDKTLKRQRILIRSGGGNHRFGNLHDKTLR